MVFYESFFCLTASSCVLHPHASYNQGEIHDQPQDTPQPDAAHAFTPSPPHSLCASLKCVSAQACESRRRESYISKRHSLHIGSCNLVFYLFVVSGSSKHVCKDSCEAIPRKRTIRAENEVEANKLVNNYRVRFVIQYFWCRLDVDDSRGLVNVCFLCLHQFGFRKWKSHVTARPFEARSDVVKELYSELNVIKPHAGPGTYLCINLL